MTRRSTTGQRCTRRALLQNGMATAAAAALLAEGQGATAAERAKFTVKDFEDAKPQKFPWGWIRWLMNVQIDPEAEMTLGIVQIEPKQCNPRHIHPNSAEYLHVLSGSCEHCVGDRWVTLKAGATIRIPKGAVHNARTGDEPCRVLVVYDTGNRQMVPVADDKR